MDHRLLTQRVIRSDGSVQIIQDYTTGDRFLDGHSSSSTTASLGRNGPVTAETSFISNIQRKRNFEEMGNSTHLHSLSDLKFEGTRSNTRRPSKAKTGLIDISRSTTLSSSM